MVPINQNREGVTMFISAEAAMAEEVHIHIFDETGKPAEDMEPIVMPLFFKLQMEAKAYRDGTTLERVFSDFAIDALTEFANEHAGEAKLVA